MGWRDLGRSRSSELDLRLSSLGGGVSPIEEQRHRQEEAHRLRVELMRRNMQRARAVYLGEVGQTGVQVQLAMRYQARHAAQLFPEERDGIDMTVYAVDMGVLNIVGEMAR